MDYLFHFASVTHRAANLHTINVYTNNDPIHVMHTPSTDLTRRVIML